MEASSAGSVTRAVPGGSANALAGAQRPLFGHPVSWLSRILVAGGILLLAATIWVTAPVDGTRALLASLLLAGVLALLRFPEISFALFLNAGMFKAGEALENVQESMDVTIFFLIVSILGILWNIFTRRLALRLPPRELLIPFGCIVALAMTSLVYTLASVYGTQKFGRLAILTFAAFLCPALLFQEQQRITRFLWSYLIVPITMVAAVGFSEEFQGGQFGQQDAFGSGYLGFGNVAAQGTLILLTYFLFRAKSVWGKIPILLLALLNGIGIFASGARGSAVGFSLALGFVLFWTVRDMFSGAHATQSSKRQVRKAVLLLGTFVVIVGLALWTVGEYFSTFLIRTEELVQALSATESERIDLYQKSLQFLLTFPRALVGMGFGGWSLYYYGFDAPRGGFPHNVFLEVGVELGWFGLVFLIWMLFRAFRTGWRLLENSSPRHYPAVLCFMTLLIYMFGFSSFHGDIDDCRQLFTWMSAIYACGQSQFWS